MRRAWLLVLFLVVPGRADDRQVVGKIFRRPEFRWKSQEKQPAPPVCQAPHVWKKRGQGGGHDRSQVVDQESTEPNGLIAPEPSPGDRPGSATTSTPAPSGQGESSSTPTPSGQEEPSGTPGSPGQGESSSTPTPSEQGEPSGTPGASGEGEPSSTPASSEQGEPTGTPGSSGRGDSSSTPIPSEEGEPSGTPTPSEQGEPSSTPIPTEQGSSSGSAESETPAPTPAPSATVAPTLPEHGPPPLDYPVQPGLLERLARWWNGLLGHRAQDGTRHILLLLRDLVALALLAVFLRHLLPVLRQLRNWLRAEKPPAVVLDEKSPEPEILPEWRQLWRQAADLQGQGRSAQAQRLGYLAVLAFLDNGGHIRYRPYGTNREYLAALQDPLREPFARISRRFELCRYGGHAPNFAEFQAACREVLPA